MKQFKILGSEPAAVLGGVEAVLAVLLSFGLFHLSQDRVADLVAVVSAVFGLIGAYATKNGLLTAVVGVMKAVLILCAAYGTHFTDNQTTSLIAAVSVLGAIWLREKNNSLETKISMASTGMVTAVASVKEAAQIVADASPEPVPGVAKSEAGAADVLALLALAFVVIGIIGLLNVIHITLAVSIILIVVGILLFVVPRVRGV